jgi:CBS domain containing-hemolysin-like protein
MFEAAEAERARRKVGELMRPIKQVPETKSVKQLLDEMRQDGAHMSVVIDEYGNTAGLATMEDLVEEILGEIRDEHEPHSDVTPDGNGGFVVSGSFDLDHLAELVEFHPGEETESTTVGGLATEWFGRVPEKGAAIEREGIRLEVIAAHELRVDKVRVSRAPEDSEPAEKGSNGRDPGGHAS